MKNNILIILATIVILAIIAIFSAIRNSGLEPTASPQPAPAPEPASTLEVITQPIIASPAPSGEKPKVTAIAKPKANDLFSLINYERAKRRIGALKYNKVLERTAIDKACDIEARNYWSHTTPDGVTYDQFMRAHGATMFRDWGENISQKYNPVEAIDAWMASPTHRANLLDYRWVYAGIGSCGDTIVLHFAR